MTWQHIALTALGVWALYWLTVAAWTATRDAFRQANRTIDTGIAICADPIDAHFDTAITEPTPIGDAALLVAETETYLRSAV